MTAALSFAELRKREFSRLDRSGHTYLDHTGSALYPESLVLRHARALCDGVLGNPHSENPASMRATALIDAARQAVLEFFDADSAVYDVCFTTNATAALRLVGESYPFRRESRLVLTADNHNSVVGIREFAGRRGACTEYVPLDTELRLTDVNPLLPAATAPSLFAFPAQSNFSGVQHSLAIAVLARQRGYSVLLDAAAFVPTNRLSLRQLAVDFVALSFYKMFGYPTGVGALIARRAALELLERPWFAGGTIDFVTTRTGLHSLHRGPTAFEDGTPDFLAIAAVPAGLAFLSDIGFDRIATHVTQLTQQLLHGLVALRHADGRPKIRMYGPPCIHERGATIAFNVLDATGATVHYERVVRAAAANGISVRGGCFCNPGAAEAAFGLPPEVARRCFESLRGDFSTARLSTCMDGLPVGAVRASLGISSNSEDIGRLLSFVRAWAPRPSIALAPAR